MFKRRRPTDPNASGSNHDSRESPKKHRVVDCVKVLLDIAKESADWFPPLKSALGGVNALIKHYEQFEDVKEKLEDLIPQLERFKQNITTTTADGDPEETNRRKGLATTFKQVEELSKKLLAKNAIARFVDKGKDSGLVVKLIERFREAIVCYQISQQQDIYLKITNLTSSFDTLLKLQEKPPVVRDKLESVVARLNRLKNAPWKELQHERWAKLFDDLRPIRDKATVLYEHITSEGYVEVEGDISAVSGLVEDLHDVLLDYWTAQQQAVYDQNCKLIDAADLLVLNNCRRAKGAEYRHGNRRGCLKGTRNTVLNKIESWAKDFEKSPVFWLNGLAGTGKSTIAQTIAERFFAEESLGASFFCSRDFEDRSDLHFIFPTLAFQLAHKYPNFRSHYVSLLRSNPDVVHESLYSQMQRLIVEPLQTTGVSTVIVIDALDECRDDEPSSAILSVLGRFVAQIPGAKFFITGRPEPRIRTGFRLPLLIDSTDVFVLHDVHPSLINDDIRLFLKHELSELSQRHQLEGWPSDEHIDLLCGRAAGLFVYAVATVKFLDSSIHLPERRLDIIVSLPESTVPEGKTQFKPRMTLDSLYTSVLQTAFGEEDSEADSKVRSTMGAVVLLVNPLPSRGIAELIGIDPREVMLLLTSVQSLLSLDGDPGQPVKPFHKSFPDFITNPLRCIDKRFCVSPGHLHFELLTSCLRVMNNGLEQDLLSLPEYTLNSEVKDLQARIDDRVSTALQYACRSWYNHLTQAMGDFAEIISYLRLFLQDKFLAWLEVLSVLKDVGGAAVALEKLMPWLQEVARDTQLLSTARDCLYFVTKFFEPINASAAHIYHSALELCPTSSIVRKLYYHRCHRITRLPRVVVGNPDSWDQTVSISGKDCDYGFYTWSPCGQFIAAQTGEVVEIRNQLTFELITILQPTEATTLLEGPISYSPDGRSLACASENAVVIWDIQTGGVVKEIQRTSIKHRSQELTQETSISISLVWSLDGRTIGAIDYRDIYTIHTHDVTSGTTLSTKGFQSRDKPYLWAYEKSFRVMTTSRPTGEDTIQINLFEVKSTLVKIYSFRIKASNILMGDHWPGTTNGVSYSPRIGSFSPTASCVSVSAGYSLRIVRDEGSSYLLGEIGHFFSHSFSSDGSLFAASKENGVMIWKYTSGRYIVWREFHCQGWTDSPLQFSPTPSSILSHSRNILRVWRLHDLPMTPQTRRQQYIGLSRSGNRIATGYKLEKTITTVDLHSKTPFQFIDTGVEMEGFVITGNILLAMGSEKVVAWLLTDEGLVDGVFGDKKAGDSDSIWTITLSPWRSELWTFSVEGQIGVIKPDGNDLFIYNTETGDILQPVPVPQHFSDHWYHLSGIFCGRHYLHYHNLFQCDTPLGGSWQTSQTTLREGWVKDPEGRSRLWVPVEWRMSWDCADWRHDVTTQFSILGGKPVVIKF